MTINREWIKKMWYIKIKIMTKMSFAGKWMELEIIMLSEISQTQKDKHHMFFLSHMESRFKGKQDIKIEEGLFRGRGEDQWEGIV
jgi:hypothetical protein